MLKFKYGKKETSSFECSFGMLQAELTKNMRDYTLKELAQILKTQSKIDEGEITFHHIAFTFTKNIND